MAPLVLSCPHLLLPPTPCPRQLSASPSNSRCRHPSPYILSTFLKCRIHSARYDFRFPLTEHKLREARDYVRLTCTRPTMRYSGPAPVGAQGTLARSCLLYMALTSAVALIGLTCLKSKITKGRGDPGSGRADVCEGDQRRHFRALCHPENSDRPRLTRAELTYRVNHKAQAMGD